MDKALLRQFISELNKLEGKEYLLATIAYKTAPTRSGIKPSSLISFSAKHKNLYHLWEKHKEEIGNYLNLDFYELKKTEDWLLILFYDYDMLEKTTTSKTNRIFLKKMGYHSEDTLSRRLAFLKERFRLMCPHEIGVFLGIPIEDVCGFIKHKGTNFLMCKYWKVYHNLEEAKTLFEDYDKAKANVIYAMLNAAS
ncbi:DUF3793 family protein [Cellulosilyticum sp. I15G10I2]|uniref:DUF3793 family protein n=1 Tax=Cellulosilyticum sp. I15G10I2 TaxID=1892843 RepID=UPI00085C15EC|nr:DUF3793 family protein [Cellulosilyticum sp. I15G10I2]